MKELIAALTEIWTTDIPKHFAEGYITYERQLQAEIYHRIRSKYSNKYEVWIEPTINLKEQNIVNKKPDIFITSNGIVKAIVEIKCCPWAYPVFEDDILKLQSFDTASTKDIELILGWVPGKDDSLPESKHKYKLTPDHLNVFIVIGKAESHAFSKPLKSRISNFLLLYGFINISHQFQSFIASNEDHTLNKM